MRYVTVTAEELEHVREGMKVLESLNEYEERAVDVYFYGLTNNQHLLHVVQEAVSAQTEGEVDEADVQVSEAVFIIPVSSDVLYYITGSGLLLKNEEAVYIGGNEGPQTVRLAVRGQVRVTAGEFTTMALSRDDMSGEDFLMQYGQKTQASVPPEVQRTEPAAEQAQKPVGEGVAPAKKSSLNFNVESWLA